ncbi:hypothetical protein SAMN05216548_105168 [Faunimonas pinastri]|uniref:Spermatogenesis-associated protein 20-like TRX domain-containing protein n=1 Tax=Faunimonas pinastri TaxID=1855383 RepID=A0A1H9GWB3_9HYPH|nr:thioredoxin domain-containing protein [Faunimonas pinastri]SEQ54300.1 hypothetical protein SAMN05216548_105168 [Faunimonas pinastri]
MNRLENATSPYLRQHADNPVDWWEWSDEALAEARARNVPIHLSIGYSACHWCHVLARESFSDRETASVLNDHFVNIKVDREERPDIDQVYMSALHALGQQGGWPLTMFLKPDGKPFWGGTYFPPRPMHGMPSFRQVLEGVSDAWKRQDEAVLQNSQALTDHLNRSARSGNAVPGAETLAQSTRRTLEIWDREHGSFQGGPKFPNAPVLEALWRASIRDDDDDARQAVLTTLRHLCQGGIYDHVGGGWARYAVDAQWRVPHFEKMLYDNAQLLALMSWAEATAPSGLFRARIAETIDWLVREMQLPGGGFASGLDADTEHEEGLTYVWSLGEIQSLLPAEDAQLFAEVYDASAGGNWEGTNVLNRLQPSSFGEMDAETEDRLRRARAILLEARDRRPQPGRDDKILADWNGMTIRGLAAAALACSRPDWIELARHCYRFVRTEMTDGDRLLHSWREGTRLPVGMATDYAQMIAAALALYGVEADPVYLADAERWFTAADGFHFDAEKGAYSLPARDAAALFATALSNRDEATPSASGIMLQNAARLFNITAKDLYRDRAEAILKAATAQIAADPISTASLQSGFDELLRGRLAVAIRADAETFARLVGEGDPALLAIAVGDPDDLPAGDPLLSKVSYAKGAATFVCDAFRCLPPATDAGSLDEVLRQTRRGFASA